MAKTKKNVQPAKNNVEDVHKSGAKSLSQETEPAKNVKKGFKARAKESTAVMVINALKALKKDDGVALASIRKYIVLHYNDGRRLSKELQTKIKAYIAEEFEKHKIVMSNDDGDKIDFTMRFNMVTEE